jgi:hypothetical protein
MSDLASVFPRFLFGSDKKAEKSALLNESGDRERESI